MYELKQRLRKRFYRIMMSEWMYPFAQSIFIDRGVYFILEDKKASKG